MLYTTKGMPRIKPLDWSDEEHARLLEMLQDGKSALVIGRKLGRSVPAIYCHCDEHGGIDYLRTKSITTVRTATEVAVLLGTSNTTIIRWIANKYLKASRNGAWAKRQKKHAGYRSAPRYLITDNSIMTFLQDKHYWFLWNVNRITDSDWRDYASWLRSGKGEWLTTAQVAERIGIPYTTVVFWANRGKLDHIRNTTNGGTRYFWGEDLNNFTLPIDGRKRQKV